MRKAPKRKQADVSPAKRKHRSIYIAEAILLALVTIVTAWAGYAAASGALSRGWTGQGVHCSGPGESQRPRGDGAAQLRLEHVPDVVPAYVQGNESAEDVAIRRFRPQFKVAFDAWRATNPDTNPNAPPGPTYMPEYEQPQKDQAKALDRTADETFASGEKAGGYADDYVRITVILAAVLFLIGIGSTFQPVRSSLSRSWPSAWRYSSSRSS